MVLNKCQMSSPLLSALRARGRAARERCCLIHGGRAGGGRESLFVSHYLQPSIKPEERTTWAHHLIAHGSLCVWISITIWTSSEMIFISKWHTRPWHMLLNTRSPGPVWKSSVDLHRISMYDTQKVLHVHGTLVRSTRFTRMKSIPQMNAENAAKVQNSYMSQLFLLLFKQ